MRNKEINQNNVRAFDETKRNALALLIIFVLGSIFTVLYLIKTGNASQTFTDIVLEYTAIFQTNKLVEKNLVYYLIFGGILLYLIYFIISTLRKNRCNDVESSPTSKTISPKLIPVILGIVIIVNYAISGEISPILLLLFLLLIAFGRANPPEVFILSLFVIYALFGIYRVYVLFGGNFELNSFPFAIIMLLSVALIYFIRNDEKTIKKICLILQCFIPLVLLLFLADRYLFNEEIIFVPVPLQVKIVVGVIVIAFIADAVRKLKKNWSSSESITKILCFGTCVSVLAFNSFGGSGAIISTDLHHPYENIIAFSQIVELQQIPFDQYIPTSGLYSFVQGFIFQIFGNGEMGNYYISENVFYLLVALITIAPLWGQSDKLLVLMISVLYVIPHYNRFVFVLPIVFLLLLPQLIRRRTLWIQVWLLASLFLGLYYPICGVAVFLALLPMAIMQMYRLVKLEELKKEVHHALFWVSWAICLLLLVFSLPLLTGMLKHILAMSGQSLYADGIARFGQIIPETFLPYIEDHLFLRLALYYVLSFVPLAAMIWIAFAAGLKSLDVNIEKRKINISGVEKSLPFFACAIFLPICYSFTILRSDVGELYSRSSFVIFITFIILFFLTVKLFNSEKTRLFIVGALVAISALGSSVGLASVGQQLDKTYEVPEGYIQIEDTPIQKLGKGFINEDQYAQLLQELELTKDIDRSLSYFNFGVGSFSSYYLFDIKGSATLEALTIRGYKAAEEAANNIKDNQAQILVSPGASGFGISPIYNYYLYNWILTSGEYIWSSENNCFLPNAETVSYEALIKTNREANTNWGQVNLRGEANSLGRSLNSLKDILSKTNLSYGISYNPTSVSIAFEHGIAGYDADYLYLDFSGVAKDYDSTLYSYTEKIIQDADGLDAKLMQRTYNADKQVVIEWTIGDESHFMSCWMGNGKLLIPLGSDPSWLLNDHSEINIYLSDGSNLFEVPEIKALELYKLQTLE